MGASETVRPRCIGKMAAVIILAISIQNTLASWQVLYKTPILIIRYKIR